MLLTKAEEMLLLQFHEQRADRAGARPGQLLPAEVVGALAADTPGADFDGAVDSLLAHHLLRRDGNRYALTEKGREYLYTRALDSPSAES